MKTEKTTMESINVKKSTDAELLAFIRKHRNDLLWDRTDVEIEIWKNVRHECKRRKIGPFQINVLAARNWK